MPSIFATLSDDGILYLLQSVRRLRKLDITLCLSLSSIRFLRVQTLAKMPLVDGMIIKEVLEYAGGA